MLHLIHRAYLLLLTRDTRTQRMLRILSYIGGCPMGDVHNVKVIHNNEKKKKRKKEKRKANWKTCSYQSKHVLTLKREYTTVLT